MEEGWEDSGVLCDWRGLGVGEKGRVWEKRSAYHELEMGYLFEESEWESGG